MAEIPDGPPVQFTGTPEQKQRFFGAFKKPGLHYGAYGLTEPGAGSDVAAIRTSCRKDGNHWVINGRKAFITGAQGAKVGIIMAKSTAGACMFLVDLPDPAIRIDRVLNTIDSSMPGGHSILTIDNPAGPSSYHIAKDAAVTVVLYVNKTVKANHTFKKGELNDKSIDSVLGDLPKILKK